MPTTSYGVGDIFNAFFTSLGGTALEPKTIEELDRKLGGVSAISTFVQDRCTKEALSDISMEGLVPTETLLAVVRELGISQQNILRTAIKLDEPTPQKKKEDKQLAAEEGKPGDGEKKPETKGTVDGELKPFEGFNPPDTYVPKPAKGHCWKWASTHIQVNGPVAVKVKVSVEIAGASFDLELSVSVTAELAGDKGQSTRERLGGRMECPTKACLFDWVYGTVVAKVDFTLNVKAEGAAALKKAGIKGAEADAEFTTTYQATLFTFYHFPNGGYNK